MIKVMNYFLLWTLGFIMIFPFYWMFSTALKTQQEIYQWPPSLFPENPLWSNFKTAWNMAPFNRYFLNTFIITISTVIFVCLFSAMAGFAFDKYKFAAKEILFWIMLLFMMLPPQVTLVPVYLILKNLRWLNTYQGLIVPGLASPFGVFLVRQYMHTIPNELIDAARIDGCSEWKIFITLIMPLIKPVMGSLAIFTFTGAWNSFLWPLIITDRQEMYTIQVGISFFRGQYHVDYNYLMAASFISLIPVVVVFLLFQRYFISGLVLSGLKG